MSSHEQEQEGQRQLAKREAQEMEQMSLILGDEQPIIDRSEEVRVVTAERFKTWHPDRYQAALKLLATGTFSDKMIGAFVHADFRTIKEVRLTCITDINKQRALMTPKFFAGTMILQERVMEVAQDCKDIQKLSIAMGIHKDAYFAASGLPQARIEMIHQFDMAKSIAQLKQLLSESEQNGSEKMVHAEVIDATPGTDKGEGA